MSGNSAQRHSAASSVPSGVAGSGSGFGIDIFTNMHCVEKRREGMWYHMHRKEKVQHAK